MENDSTQKKSITNDWEEIELKPPIDIIPDEFERDGNEGFLVEIVSDREDVEANEFSNYLKELAFEVSNTDMNDKEMYNTANLEWLQNVKEKIDKGDYQGILVVFAKVCYSAKEITNIWKEFTTKKCPKLKNKPKIFIFQIVSTTKVQRDSIIRVNWKSSYDTPSEADVLIIQDQYDKQRDGLLSQLRDAIEQYGDKEDIFSLTTVNQDDYNYQPLLISTMTRKFYFKPHEHRGHHLDIHMNLKMMMTKVDKLQNESEPKKKSDTIKSRLYKFRQSFKSKKPPEKKSEEAVAGPSTRKPLTVTDTNRTKKKTSTGRMSNASDKDLPKPVWKP